MSLGQCDIEAASANDLATALESARFQPSADVGACAGIEIAAITVPTPLRDRPARPARPRRRGSGQQDPALYLCWGATVIAESTSYPGTGGYGSRHNKAPTIHTVRQNGSSRTPDRSPRCTLRQVDLFTGTSGAAGASRFPRPCQSAESKGSRRGGRCWGNPRSRTQIGAVTARDTAGNVYSIS